MKIDTTIKYLVDYYKGNTANEDITIYVGEKWASNIQKFLWDSRIITIKHTDYIKPCVYLLIVPNHILEGLHQKNSNATDNTLWLDIKRSSSWIYFKKTFMEYYHV